MNIHEHFESNNFLYDPIFGDVPFQIGGTVLEKFQQKRLVFKTYQSWATHSNNIRSNRWFCCFLMSRLVLRPAAHQWAANPSGAFGASVGEELLR